MITKTTTTTKNAL